jgi:hypothetical protein
MHHFYHHGPHMFFLLGWLIHFAIFGTIGAWLAESAKLPRAKPLGYLVGGIVPGGVLLLLIVWVVVKIGEKTA